MNANRYVHAASRMLQCCFKVSSCNLWLVWIRHVAVCSPDRLIKLSLLYLKYYYSYHNIPTH